MFLLIFLYFFPIGNPLRTTDLDFYCMLLYYIVLYYILYYIIFFTVFFLFVSLAHKHLTMISFFSFIIPSFSCLFVSSCLHPSSFHQTIIFFLSLVPSTFFLGYPPSLALLPKNTQVHTYMCVCVCVCVFVCGSGGRNAVLFILFQVLFVCLSSRLPTSVPFHPKTLHLEVAVPPVIAGRARWSVPTVTGWFGETKKSIILISGCTEVNSCNLMHTDSAAVKHSIGSIDYATCCVFVLCMYVCVAQRD